MQHDSQRQAGTELREIEITPEMIEAGVALLWDLEGEASKEALAREVFLAMANGSRSMYPLQVQIEP